MALLTVKNLTKSFGGLTAVSNVSMEIRQGELVGLIGPNGAGKTTIFNLLTGVYVPSSGTIELDTGKGTKRLNGLKPYVIAKNGVSRTFQNIRLFKDLTVLDNVRIAMHQSIRYGFFSAVLRLPNYFREEREVEERCVELLKIFKLDHKKEELAKNLPYGEQRRLEIARALATNPSLIFLDEPAAGMNPNETKDLTDLIEQIRRDFGLTVVLIEHDMSLVMKICERIYVLDYGSIIAEGKPEEIRKNKRVIEAYLGEEILDA